MGFLRATAYPPSFFAAVFTKILRMGLTLALFQAIYVHTPLLAGWNFSEILVLSAVYWTAEFIMLITFHRNLAFFLPQMIRDGTFDSILAKPISTIFYASFKIVDAFDITASIPLIFFWIYILEKGFIVLTPISLLIFFSFFGLSLVFAFSLLLITASCSFWSITTTGAGRLFESALRAARFPGDIFKGPAKIALLYILPIGLIISVPANILRGKIIWPQMIYLAIFTALIFTIAIWFWNFALRRYSSASS